ncbi:histidinol-phosphate transaminase [Streptomyces sp. NPDC005492]|uniref:pyridoxal phosphate-dependent aminotransferase n=1 Tax=Streptomyces sp. NPDC005492 TaxID=3156883 RepID=UPI0033AEFCC7
MHLGENPWGASLKAISAATEQLRYSHRYPDDERGGLVEAIARRFEVSADRVAVGNETDELVLLLTLALRDTRRAALVNSVGSPTYAKALEAAGQPYEVVPLDHFRVPAKEIIERMRSGVSICFLSHPHDPTGSVLDRLDVANLCAAAQSSGTLLVFDESYAEFADESFCSALPWATEGSNVCVLRTFSKAYGLASLGVGYLVGDPEAVGKVGVMRRAVPLRVGQIAQSAAAAALEDGEFLRRSRVNNATSRRLLRSCLERLGLASLPSQTNFVLTRLPDPSERIVRHLSEQRVLVRDTADMGLPGNVRISVGRPDEILRLARRLKDALAAADPATGLGRDQP